MHSATSRPLKYWRCNNFLLPLLMNESPGCQYIFVNNIFFFHGDVENPRLPILVELRYNTRRCCFDASDRMMRDFIPHSCTASPLSWLFVRKTPGQSADSSPPDNLSFKAWLITLYSAFYTFDSLLVVSPWDLFLHYLVSLCSSYCSCFVTALPCMFLAAA